MGCCFFLPMVCALQSYLHGRVWQVVLMGISYEIECPCLTRNNVTTIPYQPSSRQTDVVLLATEADELCQLGHKGLILEVCIEPMQTCW